MPVLINPYSFTIQPISFNGTLSADGAGTIVTGTTRTATVPFGNSGEIRFDNVSEIAGDLQYSKNGGVFISIAEDDTITLANSDTLQMRGINMELAGTAACDLTDVSSGQLIEHVVIDRLS